MAHRPNPTMSDEIVECVLPYIRDGQDRATMSLVCKQWYDLDRLTRRHVSVPLSYVLKPQRLLRRFPNIESFKLKGKPRAAMFRLIHDDWGGFVAPWVEILERSLPRLNSIHFRRGFVTTHDLEMIARVVGTRLTCLKLDKCAGFSTKGLKAVTQTCRKLKIFDVEGSEITERIEEDWLRQLALHNENSLEELNFYKTCLWNIDIKDLELLAERCPLTSLKVNNNVDMRRLLNLFRIASALRDFCGASLFVNHSYDNVELPLQLACVGLDSFQRAHLPMVFPFAKSLQRLDLRNASLCGQGHCDIILGCPQLQILETSNVIGDDGLEVVASTCKSLKRLRIEECLERKGIITQRGLMAIAKGCRELRYLTAYVNSLTNETLVCIGENLKELNDFRLVMWNACRDFPLDDGVQSLLQGCTNLTRVGLKIRRGGVTDTGLRYIGQYGQNLKSLILGGIGETDTALITFSTGCPRLKKLEIKDCSFSANGLAIASTQLVSLRYMWVHGFKTTSADDDSKVFQETTRSHWSCELVLEDSNIDSPPPSHVFAYASLDGPRTDQPDLVRPLARITTDAPSGNRLRRTGWRRYGRQYD